MKAKQIVGRVFIWAIVVAIVFIVVISIIRAYSRNEVMGTRLWEIIAAYTASNGAPPTHIGQLVEAGLLSGDEREYVISAMSRNPPILSYNCDTNSKTVELRIALREDIADAIVWKDGFGEGK